MPKLVRCFTHHERLLACALVASLSLLCGCDNTDSGSSTDAGDGSATVADASWPTDSFVFEESPPPEASAMDATQPAADAAGATFDATATFDAAATSDGSAISDGDSGPDATQLGEDASGTTNDSGADVSVGDATVGSSDAQPTEAGDGGAPQPLGCGSHGWCWCSPSPTGNDLNGVWSASSTDAWAVGNAGNILHFDGQSWTLEASGVPWDLEGIWGSAANDMWVVGDGGTILHWNGTAWSSASSGTNLALRGVWGRTATDVWAVGGDWGADVGVVLHWDGTQWSVASSPSLVAYSAWASAANDVYVVGMAGIQAGVVHWDGATWTTANLPARASGAEPIPNYELGLTGVWGSGPNDVWAVGPSDVGYHYTSGAWTYTNGAADEIPAAFNVSGTSASDVWTSSGAHWNGTAWNGIGVAGNSVYAQTSTEAWSVGTVGQAYRYDGTSWTRNSPSTPAQSQGGQAVWASGANDVYTVSSSGAYLHFDGKSWSSAPSPLATLPLGGMKPEVGSPLIWGSASNDVWIVASAYEGAALYAVGVHWDGTAWSQQIAFSAAAVNASGIAGTGPSDVWIVTSAPGSGGTYHWTGSAWNPVTTGLPYGGDAVWASAPNDVWVFSDSGTAHWDGATWSLVAGAPSAFDAWGSAPNDVWAVTGGGQVSHWDGSSWGSLVSLQLPDSGLLNPTSSNGGRPHISGSASNDVWVTWGGAMFHWGGSSWNLSAAADTPLSDLFAIPTGSAWAVGNAGNSPLLLCRP